MADVPNPYAPNRQSVNQRSSHRTTIRDFSSNQRFETAELHEDTTIDPHGSRTARITRVLVRTEDGRVIDERGALYACTDCQRHGLHQAVMRECMYCGALSCARCAAHVEDDEGSLLLCRSCYADWRWEWLFSFAPSIHANSLS
jgi:hypothetical protein